MVWKRKWYSHFLIKYTKIALEYVTNYNESWMEERGCRDAGPGALEQRIYKPENEKKRANIEGE